MNYDVIKKKIAIIDFFCRNELKNNFNSAKNTFLARKKLAMCCSEAGQDFERSGKIVRMESNEFGTIYLGPVTLQEPPVSGAVVYRAFEIEEMNGLEIDVVRAIHNVKRVLGGMLCWVEPPPGKGRTGDPGDFETKENKMFQRTEK